MAKICPSCQKKPQPPGTYRGTCRANASPECQAITDDFTLTLCDKCAEHMGRCAWCWGPLDGSFGEHVEVPTTKNFVRLYERDNGSHTPGMDVGEQVMVELQVDPYSYYTWSLDRWASSSEVSYHGFRMIQDPTNWRQATLEIYINLNAAAEAAKIVLREVAVDRWGWTPPASSKAPIVLTVEIRR
jgi:hypothetical protein